MEKIAMIEDLTLSQPLAALSGETITTLHFDFTKIKTMDYKQIVRLEARLKGVADLDFNAVLTRKTSSEFRIATAWIAAIRGTKGLCYDDIDNLSLTDLLDLEEIGVFFITKLA